MKIDFNNYFKLTYRINKNLLFGDVQMRAIHYVFNGISDLSSASVNTKQQVNYVFLNPKIGWMYQWNLTNNTYASVAVSNREPIRKDFTENISGNRPRPETLYNLEVGHRFQHGKWAFNATYYLMYYHDQLILTGQINDVGGYTRTNAKKSYRTGLEIEASYQATKWMTILAGGTYSANKIIDFTEYVDDYDNGGQIAIQHKNTDIALSPNLIASFGLNFEPIKNFNLRLTGKYVGKQYLDNSQDNARSIEGYYLMNFTMSYLWKIPKITGVEFGLQVNNLLNKMYENNGYTYSYIYNQQTIKENFYFPQAGINFMGRICIRI
jgi:iron complex outermembrane receptor protein